MDNECVKVLNLLKEHPNGLSLRSIGMYLNIHYINLVYTIRYLEIKGLIKSRVYSDPANRERYDIWSIA